MRQTDQGLKVEGSMDQGMRKAPEAGGEPGRPALQLQGSPGFLRLCGAGAPSAPEVRSGSSLAGIVPLALYDSEQRICHCVLDV